MSVPLLVQLYRSAFTHLYLILKLINYISLSRIKRKIATRTQRHHECFCLNIPWCLGDLVAKYFAIKSKKFIFSALKPFRSRRTITSVVQGALLLLLVWTTPSFSAQVTLAWDANTEPDLAGYRIHYGTSSGVYPFSVDLRKNTGCTISDLEEGTTYFFAATAYDTHGDESEFSRELHYTTPSEDQSAVAQPDAIIVDNGDIDTFHTGSWQVDSEPDAYGDDSLYSYGGTYSFETDVDNVYDISIWWSANGSRCTSVPVEIYDWNKLIDTVTVNQQKNGGQWNFLGTYTFDIRARVIVIADGTNNCSTSADAVEFMP